MIFQTSLFYLFDTGRIDIGDSDQVQLYEFYVCGVFVTLWLWRTGKFVWGWHHFRHHKLNWKKISDQEYKEWHDEEHDHTMFHMVDEDHFFGTNDDRDGKSFVSTH